jgi:hypothetical protein
MSIDAKVRDNHFHLNGVSYFRGHAEAVQLGDAGEKKTQGPQESHLAVRASVPRAKLAIDRATQIDLHRVALGGSDIGARITIPGVGALGAATVARQLEDQALALVKLECLPQDIVAAANDSPAVITELIRAGSAGRLVHQVFVILEMKTALNFTRSTRFELSGGVEAWTVTGRSSSGSRTVVTLTTGTTFAYLLLEPQWDAPVRKNWQRIDDWQDDPWAPGLTLPAAAQP